MNTDMSRRQFVGLAGSLATVLGLGLVGCGGGAGKGSAAGSAAAKDVKGAAESKKLVVGFDKSYPPYGFVGDDGEYTGFDLDLAKAVADKQSWEVKYVARPERRAGRDTRTASKPMARRFACTRLYSARASDKTFFFN